MSILSKYLLTLLGIAFFSSVQSSISLNPVKYSSDAQSWVSTLSPSAKDIQIIANLLYISYLRSYYTLESQEIAVKTMQTTWQGWQNIAQTRMNPSKKSPYKLSRSHQKKLFQEFLLWQERHEHTCQLYANATEHILHEHSFDNAQSREAIHAVRNHSREVIITAFCDAKKILAELLDVTQDALHRDVLLEGQQELVSRFDLLTSFWNYVPHAALNSFIETEKIYTKASEQTWNVLETIQKVNVQLWTAVETERAQYYLAHYNELHELMSKQYPDSLYLLYDEQGFIEDGTALKTLPDLSKTW